MVTSRTPADPFQPGVNYNTRINLLLMWLEYNPIKVPTTLDRHRIYQCHKNRHCGYLPSDHDRVFVKRADELRVKCCNKSLKAVRCDLSRALRQL